eukprot:3277455-Prymnesium_polylepis.1
MPCVQIIAALPAVHAPRSLGPAALAVLLELLGHAGRSYSRWCNEVRARAEQPLRTHVRCSLAGSSLGPERLRPCVATQLLWRSAINALISLGDARELSLARLASFVMQARAVFTHPPHRRPSRQRSCAHESSTATLPPHQPPSSAPRRPQVPPHLHLLRRCGEPTAALHSLE